jgi:hypothetical protein
MLSLRKWKGEAFVELAASMLSLSSLGSETPGGSSSPTIDIGSLTFRWNGNTMLEPVLFGSAGIPTPAWKPWAPG